MVRRMVLLLAAAALLTAMGLPACAAGEGEIRISLHYGDMAAGGGEAALCRVAEPAGQDYKLLDAFGGGLIKGEDIQAPELAQWLAERSGELGVRRLLDADGEAVFSNLEEGLYLAMQTEAPEGYCAFAPFLIPVPLGNQWEIQANPKTRQLLTESPKTGQHPAPIFAAMGLVLTGLGIAACVEKLKRK